MSFAPLNAGLSQILRTEIDQGLASGDLAPAQQLDDHLRRFRDEFGPEALQGRSGDELLRLMHGRQDSDSKCLAYWLEFKDDEEFAGRMFGGIGGGAATKFGVYQRQTDGAWMTAVGGKPRVISGGEAIDIATRQRAELIAGHNVLSNFRAFSDEGYSVLQSDMAAAAPELSQYGWSHKYWFLIHPNKVDDFHSSRYQRFHILKLLQMTPDRVGTRDGSAPRFNCAGRFISGAQELGVPVSTFDRVLVQRSGAYHRYWRVGTTVGSGGESQWPMMRDSNLVAIGWSDHVPDLSNLVGGEKVVAKDQIREWLAPLYAGNLAMASRKAGEILNFAGKMAENDLVLASAGQKVLGVGRVVAPYEYRAAAEFPHTRRVEWLLLDEWELPALEGPQTTVFEMGRNADNIVQLEQRLFDRKELPPAIEPAKGDRTGPTAPLPPLDSVGMRIDSILRRKGQAVLYGPPGTGKTYHAVRVARELAARHVFRKPFAAATRAEAAEIGPPGLVEVCTFHPGFGYEDFIEGLRPETLNGQMVFRRRDGIFKKICEEASKRTDRPFYLVIDEFNRGDVPRIFGELITIIEHDKRGHPVRLPLSGDPFLVPQNIFLICTMNTADRSISLLDAALRRRFGFYEIMPDSTELAGRVAGSVPLGPWLDALNGRLRKSLKRDARNLQIGHAYLLAHPINSVPDFARVLRDDIIPLLEDYCYEDFGSLRQILGGRLVDVEGSRIREELFDSNREDDLLQAIYFEEIQSLTLGKQLAEAPLEEEPVEAGEEEKEEEASNESN